MAETMTLAPGQRWVPTREAVIPLEGYSSGNGASDPVHVSLKNIVEKQTESYLWTPADTIRFKPAILPTVYGDGRALFRLSTINQRPRYYVIRGNSDWACADDLQDSCGPDFCTLADDLLTSIEEAFGRGRCGYSGNSLFWPKRERILNCQCEECSDRRIAKWPALDDYGGCSWNRMNWPAKFPTVKNPLSRRGNLLDTAQSTAWIARHEAVLQEGE